MMLSKLAAALQPPADLHAYSVYLAEPDRDGTDVDLATIGRVEIDEKSAQARLYPSSTATEVDAVDPEPYLGMVLDQLPLLDSFESDLRLVAERPLLRGESTDDPVRFTDIVDVRVSHETKEVWLLLRPAADFADGLLPSAAT
jgi:hypothetical protein